MRVQPIQNQAAGNAEVSALPAEEVLRVLGAFRQGLSAEEAGARLARDGPNVLAVAPRPHLARRLAGQFRDLFAVILLGASILSMLVGSGEITAAILAVVLLNALVGFVQEYR